MLKLRFIAIVLCPFWVIAQCPIGQSPVYVNITPDNYPNETSWKLFADSILVASGTSNSDTVCVDSAACVRFEIYDEYGDGMCCGYGQGAYSVTYGGNNLTGGSFGFQDIDEIGCYIDTAQILTALQAMIGHVNNSAPLSLAQREEYLSAIMVDYENVFLGIATDVYTYFNAYQASYPPVFQNREQVNVSQLAPETRLLIELQQYVIDKQAISANAATLEGVIFEFSSVFPGPVAANAPRVPNAVVPINGKHVHLPAAITGYDLDPAKRPTGYYAAPGEIVTITIPANLIGAGLEAQIGVHHENLSHRPDNINRFERMTIDFPLNAVSTQIISPLGGGIYIKIPEPSDLGWFDVTISKAVKSPYFSLRTGHVTPLSEWQADLANHHVEWVDLEADKYMMTLPWINLQNILNPTSLLNQWNDIMDAYNYLGGRPPEARSKAEYFAVDCIQGAGVFSTGYPQIIGDNRAPFGPLYATSYYPTHILNPDPHISGLSTTFHELGHAAAHPKLDAERESLVNLYAVYIFNELYDVPLDEAFKYSEFQLMYLDEAAIDWMVSHNFRDNINMSCDPILEPDICQELQYQHRGHAKYVEMAKQYGWSSIHEMNKVFYEQDVINPGVWADIFKESDEIIKAASDGSSINMAPLFHFWGLAPSPSLAQELKATYGDNTGLCDVLKYYKTIVPKTGAELETWYTTSEHQNWIMDIRYDIYVAEYETKHYYDSIQAQIDFLIETYGLCVSSTSEALATNITVSPNPTSGAVNVRMDNIAVPVTIQVADINGRIVFWQEKVSGPNYRFVLDAAPGFYINNKRIMKIQIGVL
jgi:hypothetical protein